MGTNPPKVPPEQYPGVLPATPKTCSATEAESWPASTSSHRPGPTATGCTRPDYRLYHRPQDGRTPNDHSRDMLAAAAARGFRPRAVLSDGWYARAENLKAARALGWTFVPRAPVNRTVRVYRGPADALPAEDVGRPVDPPERQRGGANAPPADPRARRRVPRSCVSSAGNPPSPRPAPGCRRWPAAGRAA